MQEFVKAARVVVIAICVALFAVGIIWNLCYDALPETEDVATLSATASAAHWEQQYTAEQMQTSAETGLSLEGQATAQTTQQDNQQLENRIAALRMERDSSWQQLQEGLAALEFQEKQQCLKQYEELQYQEQRLELLLKAKGIANCLAVLQAEQANIIVERAALAEQYEKIYDLVQRNTNYLPEQITLVPLDESAFL